MQSKAQIYNSAWDIFVTFHAVGKLSKFSVHDSENTAFNCIRIIVKQNKTIEIILFLIFNSTLEKFIKLM